MIKYYSWSRRVKPEENLNVLWGNVPNALGREKFSLITSMLSNSRVSWDILAFGETRITELPKQWKKHSSIYSPEQNGREGVAAIIHESIHIIKSDTSEKNLLILTGSKLGCTFIFAFIYISTRLKRTHKLHKLLKALKLIKKEFDLYNSPLVYLAGDFNLHSEVELMDYFKEETPEFFEMNLNILNNYEPPELRIDNQLVPKNPPWTRVGWMNRNLNPSRNPLGESFRFRGKIFSRLDYLISNRHPQLIRTYYYRELSDHIFFVTATKINKVSKRRIITYDRKSIRNDILEIAKEGSEIEEWMDYIYANYLTYSNKTSSEKLRNSLNQIKENANLISERDDLYTSYRALLNSIPAFRFSIWQGPAFKTIKNTSKYDQFDKRDGGLITFLSLQGEILHNQKDVDTALVNFLQVNDDTCSSFNPPQPQLGFLTDLPPLTTTQIKSIFDKISSNKAMAIVPIPDQILEFFRVKERKMDIEESTMVNDFRLEKEERNYNTWNKLWTKEFWEKYDLLLQCRLIPLNKIYPKLPSASDMRPIVVTNLLYKIMETRFLPSLQRGFVN